MPEHEWIYQPEARPGRDRGLATDCNEVRPQLIEGGDPDGGYTNGRRTLSQGAAVFDGKAANTHSSALFLFDPFDYPIKFLIYVFFVVVDIKR